IAEPFVIQNVFRDARQRREEVVRLLGHVGLDAGFLDRYPEGRDGAVFPAWARKGTREGKLEGRSMVSGFFRGGHRERARPDVSIHSRPIRRLSFSRCDAGSTDKDSNVLRGKTAHESAVAIRRLPPPQPTDRGRADCLPEGRGLKPQRKF
ncbi:hypothetical protein, partial [Desulfovibrio sp.]|uniref:hypothetical protein n=1 Tax=Desulfovibrio sp. TaxID=885 RepID=UPI003AB2DD45